MMRNNDDFSPEAIDEQIERFLLPRGPRQSSPSADLTQALRAIYEEDATSLERVRERYAARIPALSQSLTNVSLSRIQKKELTMHDLQEKHEPGSMVESSSRRKSGWKQRLALFAAVLCAMFLVGSFITIVNATRTNHATAVGSQITVPPTPRPPSTPASQVIRKALLTDLRSVNSEGIGPGLAGIVPKNQFTVGQKVWLFFIVYNHDGGTVTVKWYTNNHLSSSSSHVLPPTTNGPVPTPAPGGPVPTPAINTPPSGPITDDFSTTYHQPGNGKVELYWNGQLAKTLFFVVTPKA